MHGRADTHAGSRGTARQRPPDGARESRRPSLGDAPAGPLWSAVIGNVAIVEQSDGIVLVDSGGTIADGRDVLAALGKLTRKPVKAVVLTHWHNDHPLGVPAILERYPRVRIIATDTTAKLMADPEVLGNGIGKVDPARAAQRFKAVEERAAEYLATSKDVSLPEAVRREYATEAAWVTERGKRQQENYTILPTETFADRLVVDDPDVPVEVLHLGTREHRRRRLVWLPRQKVMASGDVVVLPTPYGFTAPSSRGWRRWRSWMATTLRC